MVYPYITLGERLKISHSELLKNNTIRVFVEEEDDSLGIKEAEYIIPGLKLKNRVGFSDDELMSITQIVKYNSSLIYTVARQGGIANANVI